MNQDKYELCKQKLFVTYFSSCSSSKKRQSSSTSYPYLTARTILRITKQIEHLKMKRRLDITSSELETLSKKGKVNAIHCFSYIVKCCFSKSGRKKLPTWRGTTSKRLCYCQEKPNGFG